MQISKVSVKLSRFFALTNQFKNIIKREIRNMSKKSQNARKIISLNLMLNMIILYSMTDKLWPT